MPSKLLIGGSKTLEIELVRIASHDAAFEQSVAVQKENLGTSFEPLVRRFLLQTIDQLWVDHLEAMEYLRNSVNLRAYGQRDPLVEYKKEGLRLFQTMEQTYIETAQHTIPHIIPMSQQAPAAPVASIQRAIASITAAGVVGKDGAIGRNDKVTITNGSEVLEMKYKKAEDLIQSGEWRVVQK